MPVLKGEPQPAPREETKLAGVFNLRGAELFYRCSGKRVSRTFSNDYPHSDFNERCVNCITRPLVQRQAVDWDSNQSGVFGGTDFEQKVAVPPIVPVHEQE